MDIKQKGMPQNNLNSPKCKIRNGNCFKLFMMCLITLHN